MTLQDLQKEFDDYLDKHDEALEFAEKEIDFDGKQLKDALKNQLKLQMRWEILTKRINKIYDICEYTMDEAYASAVNSELRDNFKDVKISEAKEYAKADKTFKAARRLLIDIREVRDEARGALDVITSRKYLLNSMTNAMVASVENTIL